MRCILLSLCFGFVLSWAGVRSVSAGEFVVDDDTLFLAHFNQRLDADFAKGSAKAAGYAAIDPAGKFGGALSAKTGTVTVDNYPRAFCPLGFEAKGNLDPKAGTFEMWVKTTFDQARNPKNGAGYAFYRLLQFKKQGQVSSAADANKLVYFVSEVNYRPETRVLMLFTGGDKSINAAVGDKHDQWVHYAITWENGRVNYFLNGVKMASTLNNPDGLLYLNAAPESDKFYVGGNVIDDFKSADSGSNANSLIDEVRISRIVRYRDNFDPFK